MPKPTPKPRNSNYGPQAFYEGETWLEPEELAYTPRGSQIRRARCRMPDGSLRVVLCGIPDTYFSIPAHAAIKGKYTRGYVTTNDDGEYTFHPTAPA